MYADIELEDRYEDEDISEQIMDREQRFLVENKINRGVLGNSDLKNVDLLRKRQRVVSEAHWDEPFMRSYDLNTLD